MTRPPLIVVLFLAAFAAAAAAARAQPPAEALARVRAAYDKVASLRLEAAVTAEYDVAGRRETRQATVRAAMSDAMRFRDEVPGQLVVAGDAEHVWVYAPASLRYYRADRAAGAPAALPAAAERALIDHNPSLYLALADDAGAAVAALGDVAADGEALIVTRKDGARWRMQFDPQSGLLAAVEIDEAPALVAAGVPGVRRAVRRIAYAASQPNADVAAEAVAFAPPELAQEVEPVPVAGGSALVGKPAPALSLPDLEGKTVALEDLRGKVVLVDFWATWCGPCVQGMPHLKALAEQKADAGLVVLAVNLKEDAAAIRQFLAARNLAAPSLRVLRDADGKAGQRWGVTGIPCTAVIGRDGTVRDVIVGLAPERVAKAAEAALAE